MGSSSASGMAPRTVEPGPAVHDFDFLPGTWRVHHRRLKQRLTGSDEWEEFDGTSVAYALLGGAGNIDDNVLELPGGTYRAITLRSYDPATDRWSIWWLDGRNPGVLDPPVVGGFAGGRRNLPRRGHVRRPLRSSCGSCWPGSRTGRWRWEQAFSADGGATWEVNWVMDLTRDR